MSYAVTDALQLDLGVADVHTPAAIGIGPPPRDVTQHAALVIVRNSDGAILTVSRPEPPYEMSLPGGLVEDGETAEQAAMRECAEETGVGITSLRHVRDLTSPTDGRQVNVFEATAWTGDAHPAEPNTKIAWLSPAELLSQSVLYRTSIAALMAAGDLHPPTHGNQRTMAEQIQLLGAAKSKGPPDLNTPDDVRKATSRLARLKRVGKISDDDYKQEAARIAKASKSLGIGKPGPRPRVARSVHIHAQLGSGGSLNVRHMSDRGYYAGETVALSDEATKADAPVWVQVATSGTFLGHSSGPFELNAAIFKEILDNFKSTKNRAIPVDYEHATEAGSSEGSIPVTGAPAQGWIRDLRIEGGNLWGLVEWLPQARDQIRAGQYKFLSPAVRFSTKNRVTGMPAGARLSSVALTNVPFLDGMLPIAAKDSLAPIQLRRTNSGSPLDAHVVPASDYMPKIRAALRMHDLSTPEECADKMNRLRDMCMSAGPQGVHSGVDLGVYTSAMRELVDAGPGTTWDQLFDVIDDLIDAAIGQHVIQDHGAQASLSRRDEDDPDDDDPDLVAATNTTKEPTMADETQAIALKDAQAKAETLLAKFTESETKLAKATGEVSALTLQLSEAKAGAADVQAKLAAATEQIKTLKDEQAKRDEADLNVDVEVAFATYKDKKGLAADDKVHMMSFARADRAAFNKMYPPVSPEQRHLLRSLVPDEKRESPKSALSPTALTRRLMSERHMPYGEASELAAAILSGREPNPLDAGNRAMGTQ